MKFLAVLVLAVFSGCQANLFYADAPKPQLEVLTDAFWDYVAKATQTADDTLETIRKSQFGQDVSARLVESNEAALKFALNLQDQLPPAAQDVINKVNSEADLLLQSLGREISSTRGRLEPYIEDLNVKIRQGVEQMKQELTPYVGSMDAETLRATVMQKSEELRTNLEQSVKDLQAQLGPYTDDLRIKMDHHLEDFKKNVAPVTDKVQAEVTHRVQQVRDLVAPYAEDLRGRLDPYAQDLQSRLRALYQSFVETN